MASPAWDYLSPLCEQSHSASDPLALTLPIPSSIAQETEIAFIESRNYLISLACLYAMCLASQRLHEAKVQQTELLLVQEVALQTGGDSMFPE